MSRYRFLLLVLIACGIFSFGGLVEARSPSLVYPISHSGGLKANSSGLIYPFARRYGMTSPFGWRNHPIKKDRRFHAGMDIGAPSGTPVLAAAAGRVVRSGPWGGYGNTVVIEHNNPSQRTLYAHLSRIAVGNGTQVEQGNIIGDVGSTGSSTAPHLHFEVRRYSKGNWNAVNPKNLLGSPGKPTQPPTQPPAQSPIPETLPNCDEVLWGPCEKPPSCDDVLWGDCV